MGAEAGDMDGTIPGAAENLGGGGNALGVEFGQISVCAEDGVATFFGLGSGDAALPEGDAVRLGGVEGVPRDEECAVEFLEFPEDGASGVLYGNGRSWNGLRL